MSAQLTNNFFWKGLGYSLCTMGTVVAMLIGSIMEFKIFKGSALSFRTIAIA